MNRLQKNYFPVVHSDIGQKTFLYNFEVSQFPLLPKAVADPGFLIWGGRQPQRWGGAPMYYYGMKI